MAIHNWVMNKHKKNTMEVFFVGTCIYLFVPILSNTTGPHKNLVQRMHTIIKC